MHAQRLWIIAPYVGRVQAFEVLDEPGPGQVLIAIERSPVSAGTELAAIIGTRIASTTERNREIARDRTS